MSHDCFRHPRPLRMRARLAVISSRGMMLIPMPLFSLSRSFTTMQGSSGRTRVCAPAGKGPTNINSSTVHSSESLFTPFSIKHHISKGSHEVQVDTKTCFPFLSCDSLVHTYIDTHTHIYIYIYIYIYTALTLLGVWVLLPCG